MFRESARKFFRDVLHPQHKKFEADGRVRRIIFFTRYTKSPKIRFGMTNEYRLNCVSNVGVKGNLERAR